MVWREPTSHAEDCYFCLTKIGGHSKRTKSNIENPNVPSAVKPIPHGPELPIPNPYAKSEESSLAEKQNHQFQWHIP